MLQELSNLKQGWLDIYQILHLTSDFIFLFIQIEFNWITN